MTAGDASSVAADQDCADYGDGGNRIRQRHQRSVQKRRHFSNQFEAEKRGQQRKTHGQICNSAVISLPFPRPGSLTHFRVHKWLPSCWLTSVSRIMSSASVDLSAPSLLNRAASGCLTTVRRIHLAGVIGRFERQIHGPHDGDAAMNDCFTRARQCAVSTALGGDVQRSPEPDAIIFRHFGGNQDRRLPDQAQRRL